MRKVLLDLAPAILLNLMAAGALLAVCSIDRLGAGAQFWQTGAW
jgi:hypothetical protein